MELIIANNAGFCYGVTRAVNATLEEAKKENNVYCLGELVHNKQVNNNLKGAGITIIDDISRSKGKTIIRAHGVPKRVYEYAKNNKIDLVDCTCPNVLKVHEIVKKFNDEGYYIFLTGKKDHPENIGTVSYCDNYSIIEDKNDVDAALVSFNKSDIRKLLLISQTTYSVEKFYLIREMISYKIKKDVKFDIENTICPTTEMRQKEAEEISKKVDCIIIVGGKNSSNTHKLYDIALKNCKNVFWVEDNIDKKDVENFKKIGIIAGASTPKESINRIVKLIK